MASTTLELDAMDLAQRVTINVKVKHINRWKCRVRIALWLVRLAAQIAGLGYKQVDEEEK